MPHPDATLEELRERSAVKVSLVAFHKRVKQLGFTRKKVYTCARAVPRRCSEIAPGLLKWIIRVWCFWMKPGRKQT